MNINIYLNVTTFIDKRKMFMKLYFYNKLSTHKFKELFNCNNIITLRNIFKIN